MNHNPLRLILLVGALAACESQPVNGVARTRTGGDAGELVQLTGGSVTVGFAAGRLTGAANLRGFSISKAPVTVAQFQSCVAAGICHWSDASCANPEAADEDVAECVGFDSASEYCSWVGGRLPTLPEWLLAARGPSVQRFPWADAMATCDQHPGAKAPPGQVLSPDSAELQHRLGYCGVATDERLRTGEHPNGTSAAGLGDILLSAGELLRGDSSSLFSVCSSPKNGCVVFGLSPGAIDAVESVGPEASDSVKRATTPRHPYGFRCVKAEESL
jgi:formylglycine-generating enzyme required for sulfatase activity